MVKKLTAAILALIVLFPLLYTISLSFFSMPDFNTNPARFFPSRINFSGYASALGNRYFFIYSANSLITALLASIIRCVITVLSAFTFTYLEFRGKKILLYLLILTIFIPQDALLFENYVTITRLGLADTYFGIIATSLFSATQLIIAMTAAKSLSREPYDAARIDGANDYIYMVHILCPLIKSVLLAIFLQSFVSVFNAYLWPLLITSRMEMRTIQIGISLLGFAESGDKGGLFSALMIVLIPLMALTLASRKIILKALSDGLDN